MFRFLLPRRILSLWAFLLLGSLVIPFLSSLHSAFRCVPSSALEVKPVKGWARLCSLTTQVDSNPAIWGEFSKEDIQAAAHASKGHRPSSSALQGRKDRGEPAHTIGSSPSGEGLSPEHGIDSQSTEVLTAWLADSQSAVEERLSRLKARLVTYLSRSGWPEEYGINFLQDKYFLLDWLACQVMCRRCQRSKQLLILMYESHDDWIWEFFSALGNVLNIYTWDSSYRGGEAEDYDLVVLDHTRSSGHGASPLFGESDSQKDFVASFLLALDRTRRPLIVVSRAIPPCMREEGPLRDRFLRFPIFRCHHPLLRKENLISTLLGCLERRFSLFDSLGCVFPLLDCHRRVLSKPPCFDPLRESGDRYDVELEFNGVNRVLTVFWFALVPLKKWESGIGNLAYQIEGFKLAPFRFFHFNEGGGLDYATWPVTVRGWAAGQFTFPHIVLDAGLRRLFTNNYKGGNFNPPKNGRKPGASLLRVEDTLEFCLGLERPDGIWSDND